MSYKDPKPDLSEYLRGLTPEEMARQKCLFHRWVRVGDSYYPHFQCRKCCDRDVQIFNRGGYSVPNYDWLKGLAWDHHALNPPMAPRL